MKNKFLKLNIIFLLSLVACASNNSSTSSLDTSKDNTTSSSETNTPVLKEKPTIYLAGDSTVKTYPDNQFIGGWGQYLNLFLDDLDVVNCAIGGRSSRSFINEGRLYDNEDGNYSFSENNGKSIQEVIEAGDFLFIQFGHNDDDTKLKTASPDYSNVYNRMVPLGEPDANGIYPVTPGEKVSTEHLPDIYKNNVSSTTAALTEIAKYGSTYYSYDSGGTYKWYLKQYIDLAREKGATPVLVTPVPRVKFSGNTIIGGPGLHGDNFAYVQAVRQLADEEDCLLIDLFSDVKTVLETATSQYANYLMALKPNSLVGTWPLDYDKAYGNAELGYTGIEATHYNKYGAFLSAAKVAEAIKLNNSKHNEDKEYFNFAEKVTVTPSSYVDPSNYISKSIVKNIESLFTTCSVTNPNREYASPDKVIKMIEDMQKSGEVTNDNYLEYQKTCNQIRDAYNALNVDDKTSVSNLNVLEEYEAKVQEFIEANRPKPTATTVIKFEDIEATISGTKDYNGYKLVATSEKYMEYKATSASFTYNGNSYSLSGALSLKGSATFNTSRYVEFTTTGKCTITVAAQSSNSAENRVLSLVEPSAPKAVLKSFDANGSLSLSSFDTTTGATYQLGSAGKGIYLYAIIIEYFD